MKAFIVLCLCAFTGLSLADSDFYTDKWDNVDLDEILANRRLLEPYVKCILEQGSCTADGKELKSHIKEALETECAKCTEVQVKGVKRVIKHLINEEPAYWKEMSDKYDPDRKYAHKYEKELRNISA